MSILKIRNITIVLTIVIFQNCHSQDSGQKITHDKRDKIESPSKKTEIENDTSIYTIVQEMPILKTCKNELNKKKCSDKKLLQYIFKNIRYDKVSQIEAIESTTVISFVIEKNGEITNIKIIKGNPNSNIKEVIKNMPEWIPGKQNDEVKRVKMKFPVSVHFE